MRALVVVLALVLLSVATVASCSLKPPFECADGGCWGEPDYGASDGGVAAPDLAVIPDLSPTGD